MEEMKIKPIIEWPNWLLTICVGTLFSGILTGVLWLLYFLIKTIGVYCILIAPIICIFALANSFVREVIKGE